VQQLQGGRWQCRVSCCLFLLHGLYDDSLEHNAVRFLGAKASTVHCCLLLCMYLRRVPDFVRVSRCVDLAVLLLLRLHADNLQVFVGLERVAQLFVFMFDRTFD
jgi:hypothetical protein